MKKRFFFAMLLLPFFGRTQPIINELMSKNVSAVMDETYNYSMWVEVFHAGSEPIDLADYYFTDDLNAPQKWKPASKIVQPGGYEVLWFEREDAARHASFKLNPDGGSLYLLDATLQVVDSVCYPAQYRNISYGRKTDRSSEWVFFEQYSPRASNDKKQWSFERCPIPIFVLPGGFYPSSRAVDFMVPQEGDTIYYTKDFSEPKRKSTRYVPGSSITVSSTSCLRARTFSKNKLPSDVATSTYFINVRDPHLPVVSLVTAKPNLTDNTIGIYVTGTNGIVGRGSFSPVNFNQDWDRPANFELFDTDKVSRLNQEVDISIYGAWSRLHSQKSLKIDARKKFGDARLRYDFFAPTKANRKYKSVLLRNSGSDFAYSMMRDGFMQSLVINRMNIDAQAYQPAVLFLNGTYYGIQNLREVCTKDNMYSNYGLEGEDIVLLENSELQTDTSFTKLTDYLSQNDVTKPDIYSHICEMMDVEEFMDYMIMEMYIANPDWPWNNVRVWKKKENGKWRWILFDTDMGFNLYSTTLYNQNSLAYALGEYNNLNVDGWDFLTLVQRKLITNQTFQNRFVDRFCVHLSTTFETARVNAVMDSLAARISTEIAYHKNKWGSSRAFSEDITNMKSFSANRPAVLFGILSSRYAQSEPVKTIHLTSNVSGAAFTWNDESIFGSDVQLKYFNNRAFRVTTSSIPGYRFQKWNAQYTQSNPLIYSDEVWKYYDGSSIPASNWYASAYDDGAWKSGQAQLGYGNKGEKTVISYGSNASAKYPTAYFRKTFSIDNLTGLTGFSVTVFVDDGAAVYVNGKEIGRYNLPTGTLNFSVYASSANNGVNATFDVPVERLKVGENLIAVEVHQATASSSDLIFNLQMSCESAGTVHSVTTPAYQDTLSGNMVLQAVFQELAPGDTVDEQPVLINELVADNGFVFDDFGEPDDYIELYNAGDEAVDVSGWYLTDNPSDPTHFRIPLTKTDDGVIPPKTWKILWADDDPIQGTTHLGFKLSTNGETVMLSRIDAYGKLVRVDSVNYPALAPNSSYSRAFDGGPEWVVQAPTFDATNTIALTGRPEMPLTINNASASSVQLYPTLVDDFLIVQGAVGMPLTLTDLTGKIIHSAVCGSETQRIETTLLCPGLYVVTVGNNRFKIVKR